MQARPDREAAIQLREGESLFVYLKAGTTIASSAGQLRIEGEPRWLGGQIFRSKIRLAEGQALQLEGSGWVTLTAACGASAVNICRAEAPSLLADWLRKTAGLLGLSVPGRTARTCA